MKKRQDKIQADSSGHPPGLGVGTVAADISLVERGQIFGTGFDGNYPLLNSSRDFRVGWSYVGEGQYTFRIGGDLLRKFMRNPHINLWPPSWWFGPPGP